MAIHWQIQFRSLHSNTLYKVNIYDSNYSGSTPVQLTAAASPFMTQEDDDNDFYIPIRNQSGYLRFIVEDANIVRQIMPTTATDRPVTLTHGSSVDWMGFLSCEQYSQPWAPTPYEIEIPVVGIMEAMQGVMFTQAEGFTSLFSLINTIADYCPSGLFMVAPEDTHINEVYVNNNNFRQFLTVAERAERNTANKYDCMSLYDCVEAFCTYFGISLREYQGEIYFVEHWSHNFDYEELDNQGTVYPVQYGSNTITDSMLRGANNLVGYVNGIRMMKGVFGTGRAKVEELFSMGEFLKEYSIEGLYPPNADTDIVFYGNSEVVPYADGSARATWINYYYGHILTGGQIMRRRLESLYGNEFKDFFYILSYNAKVGSPESALKLNIARSVYINSGEYVLLNIDAAINYEGQSFTNDRLYCKIKVGNYWLESHISSGGAANTEYSWTTTESTCWLVLEDGKPIMEYWYWLSLPYSIRTKSDKFSGFAVPLPSLTAGYYSISIEFLANAQQNASEFDGSIGIAQMVEDLDIRLVRANADILQPTSSFDENTIIRTTAGRFTEDKSVECPITTRRGMQYGAGCVIDDNREYITTEYDKLGIQHRLSLCEEPHETITVDINSHTQPIDHYDRNDGADYAILSQNIDWSEEVVRVKLLETGL